MNALPTSARIILASTSPTRRRLLDNAGVTFAAEAPPIDERDVEAPLIEAEVDPEDIAMVLAEAKAVSVSEQYRNALVIGSDQILEFGGERLIKAPSVEAARRQLLELRGHTHLLHAAVVVAQNGQAIWRHTETARLTMRDFSPGELGQYLADVGEAVTTSVGGYQLEGRGIQLFDRIEGDYFAILGLPLLPLLTFLRERGALSP